MQELGTGVWRATSAKRIYINNYTVNLIFHLLIMKVENNKSLNIDLFHLKHIKLCVYF